jgi:hypothetical protein
MLTLDQYQDRHRSQDEHDRAKPVELLRDRRGIYGIGVSDEFDHEALTWMCGVEADTWEVGRTPRPIILRPDYFEHTAATGAVLQKITGGFPHGIFCRTNEERLRQFIHHAALRRAGLPWPPPKHLETVANPWSPDSPRRGPDRVLMQVPYWSKDKGQQARNRQIYHGLRLRSLGVINRLIGELHEAVAEPDAIRAARRFMFQYREQIYRAAVSRRALQLADTFPVAALAIYAGRWPSGEIDWSSSQRQEAKRLVERGARLRNVAMALGLPLALRHLKPASGFGHFHTAPGIAALDASNDNGRPHLVAGGQIRLPARRHRLCALGRSPCPGNTGTGKSGWQSGRRSWYAPTRAKMDGNSSPAPLLLRWD